MPRSGGSDDDDEDDCVDDDDDNDGNEDGDDDDDGDGGSGAVVVVVVVVASLGGATVELPPQFDWGHRPAPTAVATLREACVVRPTLVAASRWRQNSHGRITTTERKSEEKLLGPRKKKETGRRSERASERASE